LTTEQNESILAPWSSPSGSDFLNGGKVGGSFFHNSK
jgi:hypothetical protein